MASEGLPLEAGAIEAAAAKLEPLIPAAERDPAYAEAAIRAAFEAMGMKVERMDRIIPPELGPPVAEWRYISDWHPVEQFKDR